MVRLEIIAVRVRAEARASGVQAAGPRPGIVHMIHDLHRLAKAKRKAFQSQSHHTSNEGPRARPQEAGGPAMFQSLRNVSEVYQRELLGVQASAAWT